MKSMKTLNKIIITIALIVGFSSCKEDKSDAVASYLEIFGNHETLYFVTKDRNLLQINKGKDGEVGVFSCSHLKYDTYNDFVKTFRKKGTNWNFKNYIDTESEFSLMIPKEITWNEETCPVTRIGKEAFAKNSKLISVSIPNSVLQIGEKAFNDCAGLTSIDIPNSVTKIGNSAFCGCKSLEIITIPNSVSQIGEKAFKDCVGLSSIDIPNSVTEIGSLAFCGCSSLASISIPNTLTKIEHGTFSDCGITSISIPNSITEIGGSAFSGCKKLESISIPNSVVKIGNYAFGGCANLTSVFIPSSVREIESHAFSKDLKQISIAPENPIYDSRENCNAIIKTKTNKLIDGFNCTIIPASVTSIGKNAFSYCDFSSITIPNSVITIEEDAFRNCENLTSICIPNSVITIEEHAFRNCENLTSICIPNSVTEIGFGAFIGCTNLTSVEILNPRTKVCSSHAFPADFIKKHPEFTYPWDYSTPTTSTIDDSQTALAKVRQLQDEVRILIDKMVPCRNKMSYSVYGSYEYQNARIEYKQLMGTAIEKQERAIRIARNKIHDEDLIARLSAQLELLEQDEQLERQTYERRGREFGRRGY